jgi:signal peptidase I
MAFTKETLQKGIKRFFGIRSEEELQVEKTPKQKAVEFGKSLGSAFIAAIFIITFIIQNTRIPTPSMTDTILVGDFVLVNKFIYGSSSPRYLPLLDIPIPYFTLPAVREPRHADIVVFEFPGNRDELKPENLNVNYVKRLIGLPGDTVVIRNKVVSVNGKEAWIPPNVQYSGISVPKNIAQPDIFPYGKPWNKDNYGPLVVPRKGDVIQLNRDNVEEWRTIIDREFGDRVVGQSVDGKITIQGTPVTSYMLKKDYFFMMGDNRDDSYDSRFWGFVPRDKVVGQAFMALFSWDNTIPFSQPFDLLASIRPDRILKLLK